MVFYSKVVAGIPDLEGEAVAQGLDTVQLGRGVPGRPRQRVGQAAEASVRALQLNPGTLHIWTRVKVLRHISQFW